MISAAAASVPTTGVVINANAERPNGLLRPRGGLTRISHFPGKRGFSQAAIRRACSRPL